MSISGDIGAELRAYLLTQTAVSNVVGTRCYPSVLPLNYDPYATGPAILYEKISNVPTNSLSASHDTERVRIQYDLYHQGEVLMPGQYEFKEWADDAD